MTARDAPNVQDWTTATAEDRAAWHRGNAEHADTLEHAAMQCTPEQLQSAAGVLALIRDAWQAGLSAAGAEDEKAEDMACLIDILQWAADEMQRPPWD